MSDKKFDEAYKKALKAAGKLDDSEHAAGFDIHIDDEDLIEDNANERFSIEYGDAGASAKALKGGDIDEKANITKKGWDKLSKDSQIIESNSLKWLRSKFGHIRDEGHDSHGDLVGALWWKPSNPSHVETLYIGTNERIDMSDSSYGDLAKSVWKGVSDFGQEILGGAINFSGVNKDLIEELNDIVPRKKR